jgi:hypothetical protein
MPNSGGALLLAGLAAFAYYKYNKMSEDEKRNLVSGLKEKGQKLFDQYAPEELKSIFGNKGDTGNTGNTASSNTHFGEGSAYSS